MTMKSGEKMRCVLIVVSLFIFGMVTLVQGADNRLFPYKDIGDGRPATEVSLTLVDGVTTDWEGNIYISHRSKNRIRKVSPDGVITTIAGDGRAVFAGDGGPALDASLNFPAGLCLDKAGNLYVADRNNHRVRKIDPKGMISTVAGTGEPDWSGDEGPAVSAQLNLPSDVACHPNGDLYISDRSNNRIRRVDKNGVISTYAGLGPAEFGGDFGLAVDAFLKYPFGIDLDKEGNLYIADRGNNRIRKVDSKGIITTLAGDGTHFFSGDYGPARRAALAFPTDVAVDDLGNLYISDRNNNRIRKVDSFGIISTIAGTGSRDYNGDNETAKETSFHLPFALSLAPDGKLIVVDRSHFRIRSVSVKNGQVETVAGNGEFLFRGDGGPGLGATLESPTGIAMTSAGDLVFTDKQQNRIRKIDKGGIINTLAGNGHKGNEGDGGAALDAALFLPAEMAIDTEGSLYVISPTGRSSIIRKIEKNGTISLFAGYGMQGHMKKEGETAKEATFSMLKDIAVDKDQNVYVVDVIDKDIRKIDKTGHVTTVAKDSIEKLPDDEVHPNGLAIGKDGILYFSDSGSSKIRRVTKDGVVETVAGNGDFNDKGDGGPAISAGIRSPGGLAFSPDGELYIAEETTNRIRKIDKEGKIHRVAGSGEAGFSGDGGLAINAKLKTPYRMTFDSDGNLYFTDRDNNRVRKVDTKGIITSIAGNDNIGWMQDGLEVRITVHNFP